MTKCWYYCPERRPTFSELICWTEMMLRSSVDYLDLNPSIFQNAMYLQPIRNSSEETDEFDIVLNKPYESLTYLTQPTTLQTEYARTKSTKETRYDFT